MKIEEKIDAFSKLGEKIDYMSDESIQELSNQACLFNAWFTFSSVKKALKGIAFMLKKKTLEQWIYTYEIHPPTPKIVGVIMAGNIPLVGFHDLISILLVGHHATIKPSSDDTFLTKMMIKWIIQIEPRFKKNIVITEKLTGIDAVIATGSNNTSRYFEYYFKNIPNIIRKNRTSVAILYGNETAKEYKLLGEDIFSYFGLGCRNISKLFTPKGYDIRTIFPHFEEYSDVINHNKYRNNYDYYKSIYLINKTPHLDTGFLLITSSNDWVSPISVLYHQEYETIENLQIILTEKKEKIQCIVSQKDTPFGKTQQPEPWDYADGVDTFSFLSKL